MDYTEKYHLPQWVEEDRIQMTDFNEAMASIEAGISSAQTTAESAQSTAAAGLSAAQSAQAAANTANSNNCMVKLAGGTLAEGSSNVNIDLSEANISQYNKLILQTMGYTTNSGSIIGVRFNNISSTTYTTAGSTAATVTSMWLNQGNTECFIEANIVPYNGHIMAITRTFNKLTTSEATAINYNNITSMQIMLFHSGGTTLTYSADGTYALYGVK